jgi:fucose permease
MARFAMTAVYQLVPVAIASALASGAVLTVPAGLRKALTERFGVGDQRQTMLLTTLHVSLIPLLPLAGVLIDHVGAEHGVIVGSLLAALAFSLLALRGEFTTAAAALLILGAAAACLSTATAVLLSFTFCSDKPAAGLNLGYVFIGLAAVAGPSATEAVVQRAGWKRGLLLIGLIAALPAMIALLTPWPQPAAVPASDTSQVFQDPILWVGGLVGLLIVPLEAALATWVATNLETLGYRPRAAGWLLAGFWTALLGARLLSALILGSASWSPGKQVWLLLVLGLALAIALGNLAGAVGRSSIGLGVLLVGLFSGPIFPTLVGVLVTRHADEPATTFATVQALGALGILTMTPIGAYFGRHTTVQHALGVPLVAGLLLSAAGLVMSLCW